MTDLEQNEKLQRFVALLAKLNGELVEILKTGNVRILTEINGTVEEMVSIQSCSEEEAFTAVEEDMQAIYKNFNAIVTMMQSCETDVPDEATSAAIKKFLHNMFDAHVRIIYAYGLA